MNVVFSMSKHNSDEFSMSHSQPSYTASHYNDFDAPDHLPSFPTHHHGFGMNHAPSNFGASYQRHTGMHPHQPSIGAHHPHSFGMNHDPSSFSTSYHRPTGMHPHQPSIGAHHPHGFGMNHDPSNFGASYHRSAGMHQSPSSYGASPHEPFSMSHQLPNYGCSHHDDFDMRHSHSSFNTQPRHQSQFFSNEQTKRKFSTKLNNALICNNFHHIRFTITKTTNTASSTVFEVDFRAGINESLHALNNKMRSLFDLGSEIEVKSIQFNPEREPFSRFGDHLGNHSAAFYPREKSIFFAKPTEKIKDSSLALLIEAAHNIKEKNYSNKLLEAFNSNNFSLALRAAASKCDIKMIRLLLTCVPSGSIDVNAPSKNNITPWGWIEKSAANGSSARQIKQAQLTLELAGAAKIAVVQEPPEKNILML